MSDDRTSPGGEAPWKKVPAENPMLKQFPTAVQEFLTQVGLPDSWVLALTFDFSFEPLGQYWKIGTGDFGSICLDAAGAMYSVQEKGERTTCFINSTPHHFFLSRLAFRNREMAVANDDLSDEQLQQADDALATQLAKIDPPAMVSGTWWWAIVGELRDGVL